MFGLILARPLPKLSCLSIVGDFDILRADACCCCCWTMICCGVGLMNLKSEFGDSKLDVRSDELQIDEPPDIADCLT